MRITRSKIHRKGINFGISRCSLYGLIRIVQSSNAAEHFNQDEINNLCDSYIAHTKHIPPPANQDNKVLSNICWRVRFSTIIKRLQSIYSNHNINFMLIKIIYYSLKKSFTCVLEQTCQQLSSFHITPKT